MSTAYVVGLITVKNAEKWAEYRNQVPATLEPWGAELVFRGNLFAVLAGDHPHSDIVVIRFPDKEAANNWHSSPAYQALIPLRQQAAEVVLLSYEASRAIRRSNTSRGLTFPADLLIMGCKVAFWREERA